MYKTLSFHVVGLSPLIQHNIRLANEMEPIVKQIKQITSKRKKTDDDRAALVRLEWEGGLYVDEDGEPIVTGEAIESMLGDAAKKQRRGKDAKAAIISDGPWKLIYDGPKDLQKMWDSGKFVDTRAVRVNAARIMRTRPIFRKWELKFDVSFLPDVVNDGDIREWVEIAGQLCGLYDYRPKFGRFQVVGVSESKKDKAA